MTTAHLHEVLESTGYLVSGQPAPGVYLDEEARAMCRGREFSPDALWRGDSALTVYFKFTPEDPPDEEVVGWRQEIWNQGFAPLLWVVSPERIKLYNCFGTPKKTRDAETHLLDSFRRVEKELNDLDAFAGRLAMETGQFWQRAKKVNRSSSVDRRLLSDLAALQRDLIAQELDPLSAQGLIGRSIFAQYLIDREIVTQQFLLDEYGHDRLSEILRDRRATNHLFAWLREVFNGDMFPSEASPVPARQHLRRVADFLDATDPVSKQTSLFPYQFNLIPVELISSIYEQFARSAPEAHQGGVGSDVHYTRLSLVSLVLDEITEGLTGHETVFDLTCGSAIFLVEAFRKLVRLKANGRAPDRAMIRSTLHQQIYGSDISEAAVRVAAFSLYLAALELDPAPQPPHELRFEPLIGKTLIVGDAWNVEQTGQGKAVLTKGGRLRKFDIIVGNPPWSYQGGLASTARRLRSNRALPPRGESLSFALRTLDFAADEARFGLVLSGGQFFSRSQTGASAAAELIEQLSPITLVNLSHHADWLCSNSTVPAMALLRKRPAADPDGITAVQVPWSPAGSQCHTFQISPSDIITIPLADWKQKDVLQKPELLKAAFFGGRRDLALLEKLTARHASLSDQLARFDSELNRGLTKGDRSDDSSSLNGLRLLAGPGLQHLSDLSDLGTYTETRAERPRRREIFHAPLVVVKEVSRLDARPIVAVAKEDTVFTDSFLGASLPSRPELAQLLGAILSSSMASWFLLMTASTFGLWKPRILLRDIKRLPVPDLDATLNSESALLVRNLTRDLGQNPPTREDWRQLDDLVFELYGLDRFERIVARDGLRRANWQWKPGRLASVKPAGITSAMLKYARTFVAAVDVWLSAANQRRMRSQVFDLPAQAPLRVVRFILEESSEPSEIEILAPNGNLTDVLNRIGDRLDVPLTQYLVGQRELRVYGDNEVVIVKPAACRHWMGVSALEDADAVIAESLVESLS